MEDEPPLHPPGVRVFLFRFHRQQVLELHLDHALDVVQTVIFLQAGPPGGELLPHLGQVQQGGEIHRGVRLPHLLHGPDGKPDQISGILPRQITEFRQIGDGPFVPPHGADAAAPQVLLAPGPAEIPPDALGPRPVFGPLVPVHGLIGGHGHQHLLMAEPGRQGHIRRRILRQVQRRQRRLHRIREQGTGRVLGLQHLLFSSGAQPVRQFPVLQIGGDGLPGAGLGFHPGHQRRAPDFQMVLPPVGGVSLQ